MLNKLKSLIGAVAPTIGTAIGGPMGNAAMSMLADKLGVPNNKSAVEKAVAQASPEQLAEIKKAELAFEKQMKEPCAWIFGRSSISSNIFLLWCFKQR